MNDMSRPPAPPPHAHPDPNDSSALLNAILTTQARSLDGLFARLLGHAEENMTDWPTAAEAYARLAFQAQWNCRASLEAIARADRLAAGRKGEEL